MEVAEASIHSKPAAPAIQIPLLDRMWQAQSRMERSYSRAQHELERIQIARAQQAQQPSLQNDEPAPAVSTPALIPTTPTSTISETVGQDFILQPAFSRPAPNHHLPSAP